MMGIVIDCDLRHFDIFGIPIYRAKKQAKYGTRHLKCLFKGERWRAKKLLLIKNRKAV